MNPDLVIELGWKSAICAVIALALLALMRERSASERALAAHLGILSLALLPLGSLLLPEVHLAPPESVAKAYASVTAPAAAAPEAAGQLPSGPSAEAQAIAGADLFALAYALPASMLILLTLAAVARLRLLSFRSGVVVDPQWLTALARAQQRFGFKHGTALLASPELKSPVSWGVVRPVIILDSEVVRESKRAEAIIAHELAHVARLDWPALILGRLVCGLFWFNPLVWLLVRKAHELSEQAADDAVLRSHVSSTDYADILVQAARHATPPLLLAANGVAPSSSSLGRRVLRVLDPSRSRVPVGLGWAAAGLVAALGLGSAMAAVEPRLSNAPLDQAADAELAVAPWPAAGKEALKRNSTSEPADEAPIVAAEKEQKPTKAAVAAAPAGAAPSGPLFDETPEVRAQAARTLGDLGATRRSGEVARLLKDPSAYVRREAAHALGDLQDPATKPALQAALRDEDAAVRSKAAWALRQVSEAEAILEKYGGR